MGGSSTVETGVSDVSFVDDGDGRLSHFLPDSFPDTVGGSAHFLRITGCFFSAVESLVGSFATFSVFGGGRVAACVGSLVSTAEGGFVVTTPAVEEGFAFGVLSFTEEIGEDLLPTTRISPLAFRTG